MIGETLSLIRVPLVISHSCVIEFERLYVQVSGAVPPKLLDGGVLKLELPGVVAVVHQSCLRLSFRSTLYRTLVADKFQSIPHLLGSLGVIL